MSLDLTTGARKVIFHSPGTVADNRWYPGTRGNLLGLLVQSYVYLDCHTHRVTHATIPIDHPAQELRWLASSPDGTIYGGPSLGQTFFSFNPTNRRLTAYDQVNDRTGEIYYGIPYKGRLYTISYAEAGLSVFDPAKPWEPGESQFSNPRTIFYLPEDQYRPVGGIHLGPDGKMYIGTQPDYGLLGGALSVYSPSREEVRVYRNLIPQEEIVAIATDDRYVYCVSDIQGGEGSKAVALHAHFFVWDPQTRSTVWDYTFPDGRGVAALTATNGHVYFVRGSELMDFDVDARTLKAAHQFAHPRPAPSESLKAAKDGTIFGIFGDELGRYDPSTGTMQLFPETLGHVSSGLAIGVDGTVYFGNHTSMWMYKPDHPSPPSFFGQ
jgi:streptogramin lyase